jgi:periplasmic protein TonB
MTGARARNVLLAAFAISLILHLFLAGYIRWPVLLRPNEETQIAKVRIVTVARVKPHTPAPSPPPTPVATPRVRASVVPPRTVPKSSKGPPAAPHVAGPGVARHTPPPPVPTPAPTPAATAAATSCANNTTEPTVSATPDVGEIPPEVRAAKTSGTAAIQVSLDPQGHVVNASVAQSSGSSGLDDVAVQMARNATYTPKMVDCKAVAGSYTFTVKFVAW